MKKHILLLILISGLISTQCKKETRTPNELETILIKRFQAKDVRVSYNQITTTTNGQVSYENFLLVELDKPKKLLDIKFNEKIYNNQCEELKKFLVDSIRYDSTWRFSELRLKIIESNKFFIFTEEKSEVKIYNAW